MFYYLPAVGELYCLQEEKGMLKFSEGSFAEMQHFMLPSLLLRQVCLLFLAFT